MQSTINPPTRSSSMAGPIPPLAIPVQVDRLALDSVENLRSPLDMLKFEVEVRKDAQSPPASSSHLISSSTYPSSSQPLQIDSFRHSYSSIVTISSNLSTSSTDSNGTERTWDSDNGGRWRDSQDAFGLLGGAFGDDGHRVERRGSIESCRGEGTGEEVDGDPNGKQQGRQDRWSREEMMAFDPRTHKKRDSSTSTIKRRLPDRNDPPEEFGRDRDTDADSICTIGVSPTLSSTSPSYDPVHPRTLQSLQSRPQIQRIVSSGLHSVAGDFGNDYEEVSGGVQRAEIYNNPDSTTAGTSSRSGRIRHSRPAPPPPPPPPTASESSSWRGLVQPTTKKTDSTASGFSLYQMNQDRYTLTSENPVHASYTKIHPPRSPLPSQYPSFRQTISDPIPSSNPISSITTSSSFSPKSLGKTRTPEEWLSRGIDMHATAKGQADLADSAWNFKMAAEGGSSGGAVFYGLALRHGWGITKDEKRGFQWLRKACDQLITSPDQPSGLRDVSHGPLPQEVIMALFEVGNCYLQGLGVKPDPTLAVEYIRCAARMGDVEAQEHLGFLLSKGKYGIKKDLHEAAEWYRAAVAQGGSSIGLAWIYKEKYMDSQG